MTARINTACQALDRAIPSLLPDAAQHALNARCAMAVLGFPRPTIFEHQIAERELAKLLAMFPVFNKRLSGPKIKG